MIEHKTRTFVSRALKIVLWIFLGMLGLIILAVVAVQFSGVQHYIVRKAFSSVSDKTHTRIEVGSVDIEFPNSVVLRNIFFESRQRDTLLLIQTLAADVNLFRLFSRDVRLTGVRIDSLTAHITRTSRDSSFNFDFILDALSSDSTAAGSSPDTSAGPGWKITLGGLRLNGIHATYDDEVSGLNLRLQLGTLKASVDKFDPDKLQFHIGELSLANTSASVIQRKESPPDDSPSADVDVRLRALSLADVHFTYDNTVSGEQYVADLGTSTLLAEKIDLPAHHIALKTFLLENSRFAAVQPNRKENAADRSLAPGVPWIISIDHLSLLGNNARYDVQGAAATTGLDPNHLRLDDLTLRSENIYFSANRISADILHTSFREHSGLEVREISGGFVLDSVHAQLTDFTVETAGSRIYQNTFLSYSSPSALTNLAGTVNVKATIGESYVAISDLLWLQPSLPIRSTPGSSIRFSSRISGFVGDLQVEDFRAAVGDSTAVDLTGSIRGLPDAETAQYDVNLRLFSSGRKDILALVTDSLLPKNIVLPASIRMSGDFKGTTKDFSASTVIATSIGSLKGSAVLNSARGTDSIASRWKTEIVVDEFNIGSLLNDPETFGPVSLKASAAGTGLSKEDIKGQLNVQVDKAVVNGYPYRRLSVDGTASAFMFEGKAEIQDSNIAFTFNGTVNTSKEQPTYKFTFDLKGADLRRLNLTADDIRVSGIMTSDLVGEDVNDINGGIDIRHVVIVKNNKRYDIDSVVYVSVNIEERTHISVASTLFSGQFDGTITPGQLPEVLKEHFDHYFTLQAMQHKKNLKAQAFSFHISIRDPSTLTEVFIPELRRLSAGTIEGDFDSGKKILNANIEIPGIDYNDVTVDSLRVLVTSDPDLLQATLTMGSLSDPTFRVTNIQLAGKAGHDSIDVSLRSTRRDGSTNFLLGGAINSVPDGYKFRLYKDGIVFHNLPWTVPPDNELLFGTNRFTAHNVVLQGAGQSISLQSTDEKNPGSPLRIEFHDFDLATLSRVVERESGWLGGVFNGNVVLQNLETKMAFTSDLAIKDLSYSQRHVGDVALHANNQKENIYAVTMNIAGNGNQIGVKGQYRSQTGGSELDLTCDFTNVNLATIEPFTFGNVKRLSGAMTGRLHLTGTRKNPSITGELNFSSAAFNPTFLDSYLHLSNGKIEVDGKEIEIRSFDLVDTLGNKASIAGHLFTEDFRSYSFDLRVRTDKFLVLNTSASRDALYYGTVILNSDISIRGDQQRPIFSIQAELVKGTNIAFVLPESELAVEERSGIVRFLAVNPPSNSIMSRQNPATDKDSTEEKLSSMDLTSNILVKKDSKLRILIDPVAGDSLVIQGEATLSLTIDPSGKFTLTGRYEIVNGSYQLSFSDVIKREFTISQGSSLTWFGAPSEADVDITAMYTVRASVMDLIQDQLAGISQEERNKYRQELPIQVYLMMKGQLLKPDIHFRLDLPEDKRGVLNGTVYAKLNELNGQESELNKQVFALLILNRFVPENPLASPAGNVAFSDFARSSVSQLLSAQLNRLSEQYIAGAKLDVGLESYQDYSTGSAEGRTQLKLALSKQLFDERMTVQVGGNVDLEGRRSQANSLNNFAGDLKVMYKLTEDGRWQLEVFRQNSYEGALDGDITKTGVGLVFMIDFDKLFGITLKPVPDR